MDSPEIPPKKQRLEDEADDPDKQDEPADEGERHENEVDHDNSASSAEAISDCSINEDDLAPVNHGPMGFILRQMNSGADPRTVLNMLAGPSACSVMQGAPDLEVWKLIIELLSEPKPRPKLRTVNTIADALSLIQTCSRIIILTGAGVSVSCGIPDFRSRDGIYARLALDYPDLPNPQAMFDIDYFKRNPYPFFKFAKEIYPGHFNPSPSHRFIRRMEEKGKLKRNFTQNIDTLEQTAGIQNVVQCHGSFASATCMVCKDKVDAEAIREDVFNQVLPKCKKCPAGTELAIYKPDIVFFGEGLPQHFHDQIEADKDDCDLLIVIGSSLKVRPVALIPSLIPDNVPQILINREPLAHLNFDVELLGNGDDIIKHLSHELGSSWCETGDDYKVLKQCSIDELLTPPGSPSCAPSAAENTVDTPIVQRSSSASITPASSLSAVQKDTTDEVTDPEPTYASMEQTESKVLTASGAKTDELSVCKLEATSDSTKVNTSSVNSESIENENKLHEENLDKYDCGDTSHEDSVGGTLLIKTSETGENTSTGSVTETVNDKCADDSDSHSDSLEGVNFTTASISSRLPDGCFVFIEPSRYVFPGAELRKLFYKPRYADESESDRDSNAPSEISNLPDVQHDANSTGDVCDHIGGSDSKPDNESNVELSENTKSDVASVTKSCDNRASELAEATEKSETNQSESSST